MKRTPLRRSAPLKRARKRMRPRNEERAAAALARDFGAQAELCRRLPCAACWGESVVIAAARTLVLDENPAAWATSEPHHEPTRGAGGNDGDTLPLCPKHHRERHDTGIESFQRQHGVILRSVAESLRQFVVPM